MARNMAVISPMGPPTRTAPAVPATEVRMKGRIPNFSCLPAHSVPNRKSVTPISKMAGSPAIIR